MKSFKCLISAPVRLSVAMPLIFGLATIAAAPIVEAVTINKVDIINGRVDVNESGAATAADDLSNFALWCDDAAPIQVDIINGLVDVTENGVISGADDLFDCDLNDEVFGIPSSHQVDIINGEVDEDENGVADNGDDVSNVKLFDLP